MFAKTARPCSAVSLPKRPASAGPTYFVRDKQNTNEFFKTTRVESCSKVVIKNGQAIAICYKIKNRRGRKMNNFKYTPQIKKEPKTVYEQDYQPKPIMYAGMGKKPLVPYNPNSFRNRLQNTESFVPYRNASHFAVGDNTWINRKQWKSTASESFRQQKVLPITNPGILSDMAKRAHYKMQNIDY